MSEPQVMAPWPEFVRGIGINFYPGDERWLAERQVEYEHIRAEQMATRSAWLYFDLYTQETGEFLEYVCGRPLNNPLTGCTV